MKEIGRFLAEPVVIFPFSVLADLIPDFDKFVKDNGICVSLESDAETVIGVEVAEALSANGYSYPVVVIGADDDFVRLLKDGEPTMGQFLKTRGNTPREQSMREYCTLMNLTDSSLQG